MVNEKESESITVVLNEQVKKILRGYEIQIKDTLIKAINVANDLKDGKQIIAFNKLNGVISKLNLLHGDILKILNEKNNNE